MTTAGHLHHNTPGAIVLGGNFVGLGIARSLGARGIPVWVLDTQRSTSITHFSRYTKRSIISREAAAEVLLAEGRKHNLKGWVVFPANDEYVESVSTHHESLSSIYRLITPPLEVTRFALDKRLTYGKAKELGIDAPWTMVSATEEGLEANGLRFPLILKPAVNHHFFPHTNVKALPVSSLDELKRGHAQMRKYIPPEEILIQERIPGAGENQFSFCALCNHGQVQASLAARRRRQYPVEFGNASSFVETTHQPQVEENGRRFLEGIGFDGMAEVEFKFDPRDGRYKILDVNPRPWGWHTLGKAAGIDFPYLLWRQKTGLTPHHAPERVERAAWLREMTDFIAIAKSRDRKTEIQRLLKAIRTRNITLATFDLRDPVPFFAEFALWALSGLARQKKASEFSSVSR